MRNLIQQLLIPFVLMALCGLSSAQGITSVDGKRLNDSMAEMRTFGGIPGGGSTRVAYSEANRDALTYLAGLMREAGMSTRIDEAGNLVGVRDGSQAGLKPIMAGSHIDTVPNGGHYDGIVGVMAAIEVARTLHDQDITLRHPFEVIVWSNEEGGKTGSRAMGGLVRDFELDLPSLGHRKLGDGMRFLGGNPERLDNVIRDPGDAAAYLELHIEQGAILDRRDIDIGVVEGIVGIRRWNITVEGITNHAGTTPMDQREDALYTAARLITVINEEIRAVPGSQVGTVGRIQAEPGAPNVIPGKVTLSLEIRDLSMDKIGELFERIELAGRELIRDTGTTIRYNLFYESLAAPTDPRLQAIVAEAADARGLSSLSMPSGAGHDAQSLSAICPLGMIFVPSRAGISHAPEEYTSPEEITNGANVLLTALLLTDVEFD